MEACNLCLIGGGCNIRVVKQSRNQLHTGRATLRNTRHKPMSSEGAPLVDLSCSRCRCCTKTSSVHGRVCDHVKRIKRVLPTSSRPLARDSIWRRQAPPWPARRAGTRLNGASRGRQKRGGFPHARGKSLSFGEGGRKVALPPPGFWFSVVLSCNGERAGFIIELARHATRDTSASDTPDSAALTLVTDRACRLCTKLVL